MSKLKHTRKGQGITIENNISKKKRQHSNCARLPADEQKQKKKSKLYWK